LQANITKTTLVKFEDVMYNVKNLPPQTFDIAPEIASIFVSAANLLVLPVLGTISTSDLHLMLLSEVRQC